MRATVFCCLISVAAAAPQETGPGRSLFESRCAACHGSDGNGGAFGPAIVSRLAARNDVELASFLRSGLPARGMPPADLPDTEMGQLIAHLRSLRPIRSAAREPIRVKLETTTGSAVEGFLIGEGIEDLQVGSGDGRVRLLRRAGPRFRPVTS